VHAPLAIAPGVYRVGNIRLPAGAQLLGVRGATKLVLGDGTALISAAGADHITLAGLVLDGDRRPLPARRGLVELEAARAMRIADCEIANIGGHGLLLTATDGEITATTFASIAD